MGLIPWFLLLFVSYVHGSQVRVDPLVLISNQGLVRGHKASDGDYSIFLGIPYARVDENDPFGSAVDPSSFQEIIHDAVDEVKCPQTSSSIGEETLDCLRLNIYVPSTASSRNPMPVLVWIHGGDFVAGSASDYGVKDIVRHGVVVVAMNYRLGPYGFMCLDVPSASGNQGLRDQYKALNWIRNNIASFGGNPYNVTIAGQDAGATSVLLQLYSDNEKLFHKIIVESGTPQNEGMFVNADVEAAIKLAAHLGLNTTDTEEALKFLSNTSPELVVAAATELNLELKPCRERSFSGVSNFVESDPYSLTNKRKVRNTPFLIGNTNKEKKTLSEDYFSTNPFYEKLKNNFNFDETQLEKAAKNVRHFYIGDQAISSSVASDLQDFESDFIYNHPSERTITQLLDENAGNIYEYVFSYSGESEDGAEHSSELKYLFDMAGNSERTEEEQLIVDRLTTLWTNFVKYGNPTPTSTNLIPAIWEPVTADTRPVLVLDKDVHLDSRIQRQRMAYWDLFFTTYGQYSYIARESCVYEDYYQ